MTDSQSAISEVIVERQGTLGRIRLNRPKALNSLTLPMVRRIEAALDDFEADPAVAAVLVTGEGERGLCAGGDIRALAESVRNGDDRAATFWREEYRLNARISHFPKPYVALMDGITMGGGVGISAHGAHRIVTERTRVAMPETGIGFLPDIGGTWLLSRQANEVGTYLALTGEAIGASDAIFAGLADIFMPFEDYPRLVAALAELPAGTGQAAVGAVVAGFGRSVAATPLQDNVAVVTHAMAADDVQAILAALEDDGSPFAMATRKTITEKSPTSLALTLRLLRLGRASPSLETCLEREFAAAVSMTRGPDFYEGVRAAVIDKDRNPRWSPAALDEVDPEVVEGFLAPASEPVFGRDA
ncbi:MULTISPECIES: enoyl-CoA hydratase/isomerase family protein [unclassified Chelatococcus]|uniref:enoyl-CoA hydratase/isomerase family protein n=1 Tax=unclassified Chelatococcus TaxID=2638111 RepID=UPI001BD10B2B|nr:MULTISPECIES: enoyl-CoA hydratase/isomerase family protein [unclassified Chelatococcus]CAH1652790.1 Enoyl-CoA hydratase [Hyphomicrobiales bacterium]MBS7742987.1 enoyl-CoA hydratase/isomerase family protein [Chelatococcus sp. HY11]MBX3541895.1 enoyl-CoA hydratase/isomerase family protein [Chelatococcus sp.]MCO5074214.1 enoyl-CoA hydratase/isomerase family protein [Chelatococcus sp.]CAH1694055.1 Enoyl-CoA hydratase [Hyphomicrobiales bacterium]